MTEATSSDSSPSWSPRGYFLLLCCVVFLLIVLGAGYVALTRPVVFYSDPSLERDDLTYRQTMDPTFKEGVKRDLGDIDYNVVRQTNEVVISFVSTNRASSYRDNSAYEYHKANGQGVVTADFGKLALAAVGVGYGAIPMNKVNDWSHQVEGFFYDAQGRKLSEAELKEVVPNHFNHSFDYEGRYPSVKLVFDGAIDVGAKMLDIKMFDAVTHENLLSGYGHSGRMGEQSVFEVNPRVWRNAAVDIVVDIAVGPRVAEEITLVEGKDYLIGRDSIRYLAHLGGNGRSGAGVSTSSSFQSGKETTTVKLRSRASGRTDRSETTLAFIGGKANTSFSYRLFDFDFLGRDGETLRSAGSGSSGQTFHLEFSGEFEDMEKLRVTAYPNRHRLVYRLKELPGMPNENEDLDNLFETRIPHVRLRQGYELSRMLEELAQLDFRGATKTPPKSDFPMVLENVALKELMEIYLKQFPPGHGLELSEDGLSASIVDYSPKARLERIITKVKGYFD